MSDGNEDMPSYVALCSCGGMVMCCVDEPKHAKNTAKEVASCIRAGFSIEKTTVGAIRNGEFDFCKNHGKCGKDKKEEKMPLFQQEQEQ